MSEAETLTLNTPAEIERSPQGVVRRWLAELGIADRTEKDWRKEADELWKLYEAGRKKAHAFNIFWANTDTLAPAVYNSTPQPDVRRRFRDADPLGKAVSLVMERALSYEIDTYDFDGEVECMVLDALVTGRGVLRVVYEPKFSPVEASPMLDAKEDAAEGETDTPERLADQAVRCACVKWNDFRRGPGKRWSEVAWVAFRHDFTQDMVIEKFGPDIAQALTYTEGKDSNEISEDKQTREMFKTVEVWEIWDKDARRALFIAPCYKDKPLLEVPDPLELIDFFPVPRPAYAIVSTQTLIPIPLYKLYEEQAKELDKVSARINKIVDALKVRGAYSANLPELRAMLESGDNEMVAVANVSEIASIGGLDKAVWTLPIDKLIQVLEGLYRARDQIKATIYELTGLSDIIRGSTDPNETASAQNLKSKWGSLRLQRLQRTVQRVVRDIMRLKAEVIASQYAPEQLAAITGLQFPTGQQKQQMQMQMMQAQQMGQPIPPEAQKALETPSWDEIAQVLSSDKLREYRVDVETDSTVSETLDRDMQGMSELVTAVGGVIASVQTGTPVEVAKEVALAMVRRARMGNAVEDAIENFEAPPAQDQTQQVEGVKTQIMDIIKQHGSKVVGEEMAAKEAQAQTQQIGQAVQQVGPALEQVGQTAVMGMQELAQRQDQQAQMLVQIGQSLQQMQTGQGEALQGALGQVAQAFDGVLSGLQQVAQGMQTVMETVSKPKAVTIQRDESGRVVGASSELVQ